MQEFWTVHDSWRGQSVAILGGGPSLTDAQIESVRLASRWRVIAINNSYLKAPWADILYFCDDRWYHWHKDREEFKAFRGRKVSLDSPLHTNGAAPGVLFLRNMGLDGATKRRDGVCAGANSGYQAIQLAEKLGAARIALFGYDMQNQGNRTHWHAGHPKATPPDAYAVMLRHFPSLVEPLKASGVRVYNCTPGSALKVFPFAKFEDICAPTS